MENNPIKQRIAMLTDQWVQANAALPEARIFSWVCASSVDYKMIRAFIMFHASEESTIDDIFFCFSHPLKKEKPSHYGRKLISDLAECVTAWNNNTDLVNDAGSVNWQSLKDEPHFTDEIFFVKNINLLAESLSLKDNQFLVIALLPQFVESYKVYKNWLGNLIRSGISSKVRIIICDTYDLKAFEELSGNYPKAFEMLYPDLDMTGAMNQILENTKAAKNTQEDKDAVSFQQLIIKLTEAIGKNDENKINLYKKQSLQMAKLYNWPHMEALIYYFLHSFFAVNNKQHKAIELIEQAIVKAHEAVDKKILLTNDTKYYYRVAKGNLFFLNKNFNGAAGIYKECLSLEKENIDKQLLLGIYQMLAASLKHAGNHKGAWRYFLEGWEMIKTEPDEFIKNNDQIKYYAKEMISEAGNEENGIGYFHEIFSRYWGKNWMNDLKGSSPALQKMDVNV